jgi:hypothetical protein
MLQIFIWIQILGGIFGIICLLGTFYGDLKRKEERKEREREKYSLPGEWYKPL